MRAHARLILCSVSRTTTNRREEKRREEGGFVFSGIPIILPRPERTGGASFQQSTGVRTARSWRSVAHSQTRLADDSSTDRQLDAKVEGRKGKGGRGKHTTATSARPSVLVCGAPSHDRQIGRVTHHEALSARLHANGTPTTATPASDREEAESLRRTLIYLSIALPRLFFSFSFTNGAAAAAEAEW